MVILGILGIVVLLALYLICVSEAFKEAEDVNPEQLADFIVWYTYSKHRSYITSDSVVAILYLAQGKYLAKYGRPLFKEDFKAWRTGPMLESIYKYYKIYTGLFIPVTLEARPSLPGFLKGEKLEIILDSIDRLYNYIGWQPLKYFSGQEPYQRGYLSYDKIIKKEDLKDYYSR